MANHAIDHALGGEEKEWSRIAWKHLARGLLEGCTANDLPILRRYHHVKKGARREALSMTCKAAKGQAVRTAEDATQTDTGLVSLAATHTRAGGYDPTRSKNTRNWGILF